MTKAEKERKIKLIYLIILVNTEKAKRNAFKNVWETIDFATEQLMWAVELKKVATQRTFESGGLAICGDDRQAEVIIKKNR